MAHAKVYLRYDTTVVLDETDTHMFAFTGMPENSEIEPNSTYSSKEITAVLLKDVTPTYLTRVF